MTTIIASSKQSKKTFSVEWEKTSGLIPYDEAVHKMEERVNSIKNSTSPGLVWFVEHPSIYTAGTSSKNQDLMQFVHSKKNRRGGAEHAKKKFPRKLPKGGTKLGTIVGANIAPNFFGALTTRFLHATQIDFLELKIG